MDVFYEQPLYIETKISRLEYLKSFASIFPFLFKVSKHFFSRFLFIAEEEIDVVNISEKNLPTNPSARDRRALQTTVAHKIARSKQSNQRRRVSDDDSISSSTSTLSSKGSTPIKIGSQTPNRFIFNSRKRKDHGMHDSHKKYRYGHSKKQRLSHSKQQQKAIDPDEQETIEKRNLHNNMERRPR